MTCTYRRKHIPFLPPEATRALDDEHYALEQAVDCLQAQSDELSGRVDAGLRNVVEDLTPELGGALHTLGHNITITDDLGVKQGALVNRLNGGVALVNTDVDGNWDDSMAGVGMQAGDLRLAGTTITADSLISGGLREVWATPEGVLYTVVPPLPGWTVTDTDTGSYAVTTAWTPLTGLVVYPAVDIPAGTRIDISARIRVSNPGSDSGVIRFNFGVNGVAPTTTGEAADVAESFEGLIPITGWGLTGEVIPASTPLMLWVIESVGNPVPFAPAITGNVDEPHVLTLSIPAEAGATGATDLSVVTITATNITVASSTGADAVLPAATVTTAGVATAAQITQLDAAVPNTRTISTTNGLQGGGTLAANRTLSPVYGTAANTICQGNDSRLVGLPHYKGKWVGGSYVLNDIVVAGHYLAIANKATTQDPRPVSGGRKNVMITEPTWADYTAASSKYGIQINIMLAKYPVVGVRIKIPTAGFITFSIGINNELTTLYSGYYLEANRWTDLYFEPVMLNIDDKVDFMVEAATRKYANSYFPAVNNIKGFIAAGYPVLAGELTTTAFAVNPIYDNITSWPTDWDMLSVY